LKRRSLLSKLPALSLGLSSALAGGGCATASQIGSEPLLRFVAIADTGWGGVEQYGVAKAMELAYRQFPFQFVLLAGDNIYPNGAVARMAQAFEQPYRFFLERKVPFYAVLGNHDIRTDNGTPQIAYSKRNPLFYLPDRYYHFRQQNVDFFALDTNYNADWRLQLPWLYKSLQKSQAKWKIVFGHHPFYSSGQHGSNADFIKYLAPIFQQFAVNLYLCGHDHNYERFININGTTYLVHGGGGAPLYPLQQRLPQSSFFQSVHSFVLFSIYSDRILWEARDMQNNVIDQSQIV
jgi:Predicted phosphohydrolases